jgi:hypothetical protein
MRMSARTKQLTVVAAVMAALGSTSCGNVVRDGRSPAFLVIDSLGGIAGGGTGQGAVPLLSDVITVDPATKQNIVSDDLGVATVRVVLKDQGVPGATTTPSVVNAVTITGYHVEFVRTDGRGTPGVDVPFPFDGGVTTTVTATPTGVVFELVRHNAKEEAPLKALATLGGRVIISTIAHITFYGHDLVGNDVQVIGNLSVNFSDFADTQ